MHDTRSPDGMATAASCTTIASQHGVDLEDLIAACQQAFPALAVSPAAFVAHLEGHRPADCPPEAWLASVHAEDLYLAFACLAGTREALAAFDARFGGDIDRALASLDRRGIDDAKQVLRQRLFTGATPKIATYSGRGPLRRWLRVVAGRILLEVVAARETLADDWETDALPEGSDDPELAYIKARYRSEYKAAFADALAAMPDRDRTVLAQYHIDSLTIDQLGALYRIHRVTASRWVIAAQTRLRQRVIEVLRERLGLASAELASVTRLVRSQLTMSLARAFARS